MNLHDKEKQPLIWALLDDRAGNTSQTMGIVEALNLPYEVKKITYNHLVKLPNFIRSPGFSGIDRKKSDVLSQPWPSLIIATGRRLAPLAAWISMQSKEADTRYVQVMWPGTRYCVFADVLVLPEHDHVTEIHPFILRTLGAANRITPAALEKLRADACKRFEAFPGPRIGVLVGGDSRHGKWSERDIKTLVDALKQVQEQAPMSLLITTSRRTPEALKKAIAEVATAPCFFYQPGDAVENPYRDIMAAADHLIVTGDSVAMCSEAASSGKPTWIAEPVSWKKSKISKFLQALYEKKHARPLAEFSLQARLEVPALDDAGKIARELKRLTFLHLY
jgi:mitochondrial fission protein ELM1